VHVVGERPRSELRAGVIDHMAFSATDLRSTLAMLDAKGMKYQCRQQIGTRIWQVFLHDPNGAKVELDFSPGRAWSEVRGEATPEATLDHLVVAAVTLADGIEYFAEMTGVAAQPGGKHVAMGTHNALVRLSERTFLEILAIDPEGTKPARPRWFGLDHIALQAELTERPRLIHWVSRTQGIEAAAAACPIPLGRVHSMARGNYRWRITIPDDGSLPGKGIMPTLIEWDVPQHPAESLPNSNLSL
jgi:hypothetical protein